MTKEELKTSLIADLGVNYDVNDSSVLDSILDETINDALHISNRQYKLDRDTQLGILASDIRKCSKTLYLQRGAEDVTQQSQNGLSSNFVDAKEIMRNDIIKGGKRVLL